MNKRKRDCKHIIKDVPSITCPYCNKSGFKMLHWGHLLKLHNKKLEDVLTEFPNLPTMTKKESDRRSKKRMECNSKINKTCNSKYGGVGYSSKILQEKTINTLKDRYNVTNVMLIKEVSDKFLGENNSMKNPETLRKLSKALKGKPSKLKGRSYIEIHGPEKTKKLIKQRRISGAISCSLTQNPSKPQIELFNLTKELFNDAEINYPISYFNVDILIPSKKLIIEYDGTYWHPNKEKDTERQKDIENLGFKFIRYVDRIPTKIELLKDIQNII